MTKKYGIIEKDLLFPGRNLAITPYDKG